MQSRSRRKLEWSGLGQQRPVQALKTFLMFEQPTRSEYRSQVVLDITTDGAAPAQEHLSVSATSNTAIRWPSFTFRVVHRALMLNGQDLRANPRPARLADAAFSKAISLVFQSAH